MHLTYLLAALIGLIIPISYLLLQELHTRGDFKTKDSMHRR
jgi:hypothetical protein